MIDNSQIRATTHRKDSSADTTCGDDVGAILAIAVVMVTVVFIIVFGALQYASTNLRGVTTVYRPSRTDLYAADGALKAAGAYLATNPSAGQRPVGGGCNTMPAGTTTAGAAISVAVCPAAGSFAPAAPVLPWTVVALAAGTEPGLRLTATGNGTGDNGPTAGPTSSKGVFTVNGGVFSDTNIDVGPGARLQVAVGNVVASDACSGTIVTDAGYTTTCTSDAPLDADPNPVPATTTRPGVASGSCSATTSIATLNPGTWTQAPLVAAIGACTHVWMSPGVHYLEDINWTIGQRVIAGTLTGPIKSSATGAGCDMAEAGAQLILGGTTRITLAAGGSLQACGIPTDVAGTTVRIPVFGLKADIGTTVVVGGTYMTDPATVTPTQGTWVAVDQARVRNGVPASVTVPRRVGQTDGRAQVTFSNYTVPVPLPPNLTVTLTAALRSSRTKVAASATLISAGSATNRCTLPLAITKSTSLRVATAVFGSTACPGFSAVAPLTVTLAVTNAGTQPAEAYVDGAGLSFEQLGSTTVEMKGATGCVTATATGSCSTIDTAGRGAALWLGGLTYVPAGRLSVDIVIGNQPVFTTAVIARALWVASSSGQLNNTMAGADGGVRANGDVTMTVSVQGVSWVAGRWTYIVAGTTITPRMRSWVVLQ